MIQGNFQDDVDRSVVPDETYAAHGMGPLDELELPSESGRRSQSEELQAIVQAMAGPTGSMGMSGANRARAPLQPTFATCTTPTLGTNTLHEIEQAAQVCDDVIPFGPLLHSLA